MTASPRRLTWSVIAVFVMATLGVGLGALLPAEPPPPRGPSAFDPGAVRPSPSTLFVVDPELVDPQADTWVVVIRDHRGVEVFRDGTHYPAADGLIVTWLSNADQLWVLSGRSTVERITRGPTGWAKVLVPPVERHTVPREIARHLPVFG